jgi:hypothetical protein
MNDDELRNGYAEVLRRRPTDRASCPGPEALRALVERNGPEASRLATLDHVMGCAPCRAEFDLLAAVASGPPASTRRRYLLPVAVAAGVTLVVSAALLWRSLEPTVGGDVMRGPGDAVQLVSPRSVVDERPVRFVWSSAGGQVRYGLEVFTFDGDRVYAAEVRDTTALLPDSVELVRGRRYHWWLVLRYPDGREARTRVESFTP